MFHLGMGVNLLQSGKLRSVGILSLKVGKPWKRGRSHRLPFVAFIFGSGVRSVRANSSAVPHQVHGKFTLSIVCLFCYQDMTARTSSTLLAIIFMENVRI